MLLFKSFLNHLIIILLSVVVSIFNLLTIWVIWKRSPKTMGNFRYYMLNMAVGNCELFNYPLQIADFLFAFTLSWIFMPNLLLPLPGALAEGLMRFFGPSGAYFAFVSCVVTGGFSMTAVRECSVYRIFLFFKMDKWMKRANGTTAIIFEGCMYLIVIVAICLFDHFTVSTTEEIEAYALRYNLTHITDAIPAGAPLIAFDLDKLLVRVVHVFIGIFLVFTATVQLSTNYAVHLKIKQSKTSMSTQTLQMQRGLTYILFTQAVVPVISLSAPVIIYQLALFFYFYAESFMQLPVMEWLIILTVGGYPMINCCFCLYLLKPYRLFCIGLLKRALFCVKWDKASTVAVADSSGTSFSVVSIKRPFNKVV